MVGIPVSAHFISGTNTSIENISSPSSVDSILPFPDAGLKSGRVYFTSSVRTKSNEVASYRDFLKVNVPSRTTLGFSKEGRLIQAFFFPGTSEKTALIIGGVHGSELSSIDVAHAVINQLSTGFKSYYNVIIIPCLFPDNAYDAESKTSEIGSPANIGRYSSVTAVDPNRQMPSLGKAPNSHTQTDHLGRKMEQENFYLVQLISEYKPDRIVNIHAIRNEAYAGVFADPRTDSKGIALGFETDSSLAINMAEFIHKSGGFNKGNNITIHPTAVYLKDPQVVPAGEVQARNLCGAKLPGNRGSGVSLGGWASTAVCDHEHPEYNRPAIRLLTMEFPGYKAPRHYQDQSKREQCQANVNAYASSITNIFLQNFFVEEAIEPCDPTASLKKEMAKK